mmetsp:Transcript_4158/g.13019  ORF Transcript_4158/g.13019 Transcript_4158/m.13019 type:complete len:233 (-) Transcript_4158:189-887(-)
MAAAPSISRASAASCAARCSSRPATGATARRYEPQSGASAGRDAKQPWMRLSPGWTPAHWPAMSAAQRSTTVGNSSRCAAQAGDSAGARARQRRFSKTDLNASSPSSAASAQRAATSAPHGHPKSCGDWACAAAASSSSYSRMVTYSAVAGGNAEKPPKSWKSEGAGASRPFMTMRPGTDMAGAARASAASSWPLCATPSSMRYSTRLWKKKELSWAAAPAASASRAAGPIV